MIAPFGATLLAAGTTVALAGGKRRTAERLTLGTVLEDGAVLTSITEAPTGTPEVAVLVGACALAAGSPSPSLTLTPLQWIALGERLVPAAALVNGASIERLPSPPGRWFALATDRPTLLLANGAPLAAPGPNGALAPAWRPLAAGPELNQLRASLCPPPPPALRLWIGTSELACAPTGDGVAATLPPSAGAPMEVIRLASPMGRSRDPQDGRRFGVAVLRVELDGKPVALDGASFGEGFYQVERQDDDAWRWTNGNATLALPPAPRPRTLAIRLAPWHRALEPA